METVSPDVPALLGVPWRPASSAHVMGLVLTRNNLMGDADAIAAIEDNLDRFKTGKEMSPLDLFDLAMAARALPFGAVDELFPGVLKKEFADLLREADKLDVNKAMQENGGKFAVEKLQAIADEDIRDHACPAKVPKK